MERLALGKKTTPLQRSRVDRFVMSRDYFEEIRSRRSFNDYTPIDIWSTKHRHQKEYKKYLDDAFGLESRRGSEEDLVAPWPCVSRKKPYLSSADSILDLPTYNMAAFPELIDWSSNNLLVAALGRKYHMFGWRSQQVMGNGLTSHLIQCCKFDPRGELLLIGTDFKTVELHCNMWKLWTSAGRCKCTDGISDYVYCSITAVDWSPTGNSFVTGCSRGVVSTFDRTSVLISSWKNSERVPVLSVRVSPDTRFVAIVKVDSPFVHVLVWPSLKYHSSLNSNLIVKSITWHPWRSALLAVGGVTNFRTTVALWNTPSSRLKEMTLGDYHYTLDAMLFSQITGEMVLSLWNSEVTSIYPKISQLVVFSDPDTVVDQSGEGRYGLDRVRTMVFSPDGTKLATATADEDLIIWNFLPEDKKKGKIARHRNLSAMPVYFELVTQGFVLR